MQVTGVAQGSSPLRWDYLPTAGADSDAVKPQEVKPRQFD